jgi:bifunctional DNase/RNase
LAEKGGGRSFAIKIGTAEAIAIERRLRGDAPPRPQTHELLESAIRALGGELERVLIHTLDGGTFFATLQIRQHGELVEVDARPSDALALAVSRRTPIEVDEDVVREASDERPDVLPPIEAGEEDDDE